MTRVIAIRQAACSSLALAALLVLLPAGARAESPITAPCTLLLPETNEPVPAPCNAQGSPELAAAATVGAAPSGEDTLIENGWDFTKMDSIPGFSSTPYPVLSNPEIAD
jgi:hypothetical protein